MRTPCKEQTNVFNIQKYSVHDGPGIRTIVFLQGCPLHCPWCANPEGQSFTSVLSHNQNLCRQCGRCVDVCPQKAIRLETDGIHIDRSLCSLCGINNKESYLNLILSILKENREDAQTIRTAIKTALGA